MYLFFSQIIEKDINPYVDQWEAEGRFPAHEVFKKLGDAGFLGVTKPTGMFSVVLRAPANREKLARQYLRVLFLRLIILQNDFSLNSE